MDEMTNVLREAANDTSGPQHAEQAFKGSLSSASLANARDEEPAEVTTGPILKH